MPDRDTNGHRFVGHMQPGTPDWPTDYVSYCDNCGMEDPGSADDIPACPEAEPPRGCKQCGGAIRSREERKSGLCCRCEVASWSPEKRASVNRLIGMAFRDPKPSDDEVGVAVAEALKHVREES